MKPDGLFFTGGIESTLLLYQLSLKIGKINLYTMLDPSICLTRVSSIINYIEKHLNVKQDSPFIIPWNEKKTEYQFIRWARHLAEVELEKLYIGSNERMEHLPKREYIEHKNILIPFRGYTKDYIVRLYIENNLTDLLSMTHSCSINKNINCGDCMGCIEKTWAFKRNNL